MNSNITVNEAGNLALSGVDCTFLAAKYGTPLFVMDEERIRSNCRKFKNSMDMHYGEKGMVLYASKAFSCKEIYRIVKDEGLGIDVVSGGELFTALSVDFPSDKIYFHGNNKTPAEILMAIENNVGTIVVDNLTELEFLSSIASSYNKTVNIMLRIKPGIDAHTHDFVQTGQIDSKFGFALETGEAEKAFKASMDMPSLNFKGLHCHIGSQIFDIDPFELAAKVMLEFAVDMKNKYNYEITELNLGGGFGISYLPEEKPTLLENYLGRVAKVINTTCEKHGFKIPNIRIEPGRSIVGDSGLTLYTVGGVKEIPNIRTYVSVDGGMTDNPRYILYGSNYELIVANKASQLKEKVVTVAGRCCESGDLIQENTLLQDVAAGDVIAVLATGAYNYSMSSNYNRVPRPAVVMLKDGKDRVIINKESYEDLVRNDI